MKTDAIQRLINEAPEARAAAHEVAALEEAAEALLAIVNTMGFASWLGTVDPDGEQASNAMDALRKVGLL